MWKCVEVLWTASDSLSYTSRNTGCDLHAVQNALYVVGNFDCYLHCLNAFSFFLDDSDLLYYLCVGIVVKTFFQLQVATLESLQSSHLRLQAINSMID